MSDKQTVLCDDAPKCQPIEFDDTRLDEKKGEKLPPIMKKEVDGICSSTKYGDLLIAPCSFECAKYSCENYHYSKKMLRGRTIKHGVWEDNVFKGVIVYSNGINRMIASPYNLDYSEVCELSRIALDGHQNFLSKILAKSLKLLHIQNPLLKIVVSYADPNENHLGVIYQATNWIYEGQKRNSYQYIINGELVYGKSVYDRYGTSKIKYLRENVDENAKMIYIEGKYKYCYPMTKTVRKQYMNIHKPYPKVLRCRRK